MNEIMKTQENQIIEQESGRGLSVSQIKDQITRIQELIKSVMVQGEHYDTIPGCGKKPALLKPGGEILAMSFNLVADINPADIKISDMGNGHREYIINCPIKDKNNGKLRGYGVGSASTMESKWRYRWEDTGFKPTKDEAIILKSEGRGRWTKDNKEGWKWLEKVENRDIADIYNTALKICKKRAFIDGIINTLAVSNHFTQDIEENPEKENILPVHAEPVKDKPVNTVKEKIQEAAKPANIVESQEKDNDTIAMENAELIEKKGFFADIMEWCKKDKNILESWKFIRKTKKIVLKSEDDFLALPLETIQELYNSLVDRINKMEELKNAENNKLD